MQTIAPGSRLGWFTCSSQLAERFERQGETSTQNPCGFGQSIITQLITEQWGLGGYVRWLRGIRTNYTLRRDALLDAFMDKFDLTLASGSGYREGAAVYEATFKHSGGCPSTMAEKRPPKVLSFIPPTGGMFLWLEVRATPWSLVLLSHTLAGSL
jgi:aromatic amino acid aminotransferase I